MASAAREKKKAPRRLLGYRLKLILEGKVECHFVVGDEAADWIFTSLGSVPAPVSKSEIRRLKKMVEDHCGEDPQVRCWGMEDLRVVRVYRKKVSR